VPETRDSVRDVWGPRAPFADEWTPRVDERTIETPDSWVQSACVLCSNGCALDIGVKNGRIVGVRGREGDRVNRGRLGPKGLHGWEANNSADRLTRPLMRRGDRLEPVSWDEAMGAFVDRARQVLREKTSLGIGVYDTGQLFIEEYYTLNVIVRAGLGTPHLDGNTRLCTATAAQSLIETFGSDGQPGSYADFDVTDAFFHVGHNVASQQTVLWSRILDRRRGPRPPALVVVDPRRTATAKEADVHLAPKLGTNLALLNGVLQQIIEGGYVDSKYVEAHTVGFEGLKKVVGKYTPDVVESICDVSARDLRRAVEIIGTTKSLVSTVLQGVYQSHQATAAACQVNNLHLLRGMLGRPGCGLLQMNGQPTAQNTRETGCDGAFSGFRNWANPEHIRTLAKLWNVEPSVIPHWAPPTHAMQILRFAEQGSIGLLWIVCSNPMVSLPELHRVRRILEKDDLFVVVQDAFLTETAALADLVLPAAIWGEKTGTFTNADRTVHLSRKAVEPPGEARSDLDIFLDFARRMELKDKDGRPLIPWTDAEAAFEAWKECSRGRPCDYSGLSYAKLGGPSGIPWPCNVEHPEGAERIYTDGVFPSAAETCEAYGHDLDTGASTPPNEYKARDPMGRAILKAADYRPPPEVPSDEYPIGLTTGRVVYHFHTRTKTGRAAALRAAAPEAFVQLSEEDARERGIEDGDLVEVRSRRAAIVVPAKIGEIRRGVAFVPFHYGDADRIDDSARARAANDLTLTSWDPVSKQPHFKFAAVQLTKVEGRLSGPFPSEI
jgi:anaerobic selenocysteine-containing dehydrogenase